MMVFRPVFLGALLTLAPLAFPANQTGLNLTGPVKTVKIKSYSVKKKYGDQSFSLLEVTDLSFDKKGNKTKETQTDPNGVVIITSAYEYTPQGLLKQKKSTLASGLEYRYTYRYDRNRRLIEETGYGPENNVEFRTEYKYHRQGQLAERIGHNSEDKINYRIKYRYDRQLLVEELEYEPEEHLVSETRFIYDKAGNLKTKEFIYHSDGIDIEEQTTQGKVEFEYDHQGKIVSEYRYQNKEAMEKIKLEYDEKGNIVEEWRYDIGDSPASVLTLREYTKIIIEYF